jgi:hypothetical protein
MIELAERAAEPLDQIRRAFFRFALGVPRLASFVTSRDRRVALIATAHALIALVATILAPTVLIVLGPILLGVAHVGADVRYLVLRRKLPAWWKNAIWIGIATLVIVRIAQELAYFPAWLTRAELGVVTLWAFAALLAGGAVSGRWGRVALALPIVLGFFVAALKSPYLVVIIFTHVHNLVALALWVMFFRSRKKAAILPLAVIFGATALLLSGRTYGLTEQYGIPEALGLHVLVATDWFGPGLAFGPALGLTMAFTFLQSVHYSTWLLVIPQEDVKSQGSLTFRMSIRTLFKDLGRPGVIAIAITVVTVLVAALFNVHGTRRLYLSLAMFHGYLELAMLAYFFARGGFGSPETANETANVPATATA